MAVTIIGFVISNVLIVSCGIVTTRYIILYLAFSIAHIYFGSKGIYSCSTAWDDLDCIHVLSCYLAVSGYCQARERLLPISFIGSILDNVLGLWGAVGFGGCIIRRGLLSVALLLGYGLCVESRDIQLLDLLLADDGDLLDGGAGLGVAGGRVGVQIRYLNFDPLHRCGVVIHLLDCDEVKGWVVVRDTYLLNLKPALVGWLGVVEVRQSLHHCFSSPGILLLN
jgi:hypothetical protein